MITICQHCKRLLKVDLRTNPGKVSHGDCYSYDNPCSQSKAYMKYVEKAIERIGNGQKTKE